MLIDKVYKAVELLAAKDFTGGYIPPSEFNKFAELAQIDILSEKYNSTQVPAYGQGYSGDELFGDLKTKAVISLSSGLASKPSDYLFFSQAHGYAVIGGNARVVPIDYVQDTEWVERNGSFIDQPDLYNPIMRQLGSNFEVAPEDISQITLTYIKLPLEPFWNYTASGNVLTFVETGGSQTNPNSGVAAGDSTDFTLSESEFSELVFKICKYLGTEIRDNELYQLIENENVSDQ